MSLSLKISFIFLILGITVYAAYDDVVVGAAANSKIIEVAFRSSTTGQMLTGVAYGSVAYTYTREGDNANRGAGTCVTMTLDTYADHGWVETSTAGLYQFGIPQAALATGKNAVTITLKATGAIDVSKRILITGTNLRSIPTPIPTPDVSGMALDSTVAKASTALSTAVWTAAKAGMIDTSTSTRLATSGYTAPDNASTVAAAASAASADSKATTIDTVVDLIKTAVDAIRVMLEGR